LNGFQVSINQKLKITKAISNMKQVQKPILHNNNQIFDFVSK